MTNERNSRGRRAEPEGLSPDDYIESRVDAAVAPLARYLTRWQTRLVRSIVQASIEADPVSRRLVANAIRTRFRARRVRSRAESGSPSTKKIRRP